MVRVHRFDGRSHFFFGHRTGVAASSLFLLYVLHLSDIPPSVTPHNLLSTTHFPNHHHHYDDHYYCHYCYSCFVGWGKGRADARWVRIKVILRLLLLLLLLPSFPIVERRRVGKGSRCWLERGIVHRRDRVGLVGL
ncbi:hypothetical protein F4806DRAFT_427891 [Annulohypoxylon nitens]|nr:hypothetical protein F4806DRAFT_427891 [Annulohypoxylon nitens]